MNAILPKWSQLCKGVRQDRRAILFLLVLLLGQIAPYTKTTEIRKDSHNTTYSKTEDDGEPSPSQPHLTIDVKDYRMERNKKLLTAHANGRFDEASQMAWNVRDVDDTEEMFGRYQINRTYAYNAVGIEAGRSEVVSKLDDLRGRRLAVGDSLRGWESVSKLCEKMAVNTEEQIPRMIEAENAGHYCLNHLTTPKYIVIRDIGMSD